MFYDRIKAYATSGRMDDPYTFMGLLAAEGAIPGISGDFNARPSLKLINGFGTSIAHPAAKPGMPKAA